MALWLQNFVNTELKEEEQNIPKRIKSSSSVFMPSVTYCLLFRDLQIGLRDLLKCMFRIMLWNLYIHANASH